MKLNGLGAGQKQKKWASTLLNECHDRRGMLRSSIHCSLRAVIFNSSKNLTILIRFSFWPSEGIWVDFFLFRMPSSDVIFIFRVEAPTIPTSHTPGEWKQLNFPLHKKNCKRSYWGLWSSWWGLWSRGSEAPEALNHPLPNRSRVPAWTNVIRCQAGLICWIWKTDGCLYAYVLGTFSHRFPDKPWGVHRGNPAKGCNFDYSLGPGGRRTCSTRNNPAAVGCSNQYMHDLWQVL